MDASCDGHEGFVRLLLARGADAALRDSHGMTALWYAKVRGTATVVALLEAVDAPV